MYARDCVKACTVCTHNLCMHTNAQVRPLIWFVFIFCFYYKSPPLCSQECIRALGRKGAHLPFRGSVLTQVHTYIWTYMYTCDNRHTCVMVQGWKLGGSKNTVGLHLRCSPATLMWCSSGKGSCQSPAQPKPVYASLISGCHLSYFARFCFTMIHNTT